MKILQLTGKKRSGKDYIAKLIKEVLEEKGEKVEIFHYADPMKEIIANTFGISVRELDKYKNNADNVKIKIEQYDDYGEKTCIKETDFREILQRFGTEGARKVLGNNLWIDIMKDKVVHSDADFIIIPDCRFKNEYESIGGKLIRIKNKDIEEKIDKSSLHISEKDLDNIKADLEIDNTGYRATKRDIENNIINLLGIKEKAYYPQL